MAEQLLFFREEMFQFPLLTYKCNTTIINKNRRIKAMDNYLVTSVKSTKDNEKCYTHCCRLPLQMWLFFKDKSNSNFRFTFFKFPIWAQYVLCIRGFKTGHCSLDTHFWTKFVKIGEQKSVCFFTYKQHAFQKPFYKLNVFP